MQGSKKEQQLSGGGENKKALLQACEEGLGKNFGSVLLSHLVTKAVPSALEGLTSVFGMGTGVSPPLSPPKRKNSDNFIFAAHERNEKLWSSLTTH